MLHGSPQVEQDKTETELDILAIQLEVDQSLYSSFAHFFDHVSTIIEESGPRDLIIFPEYTSVFLLLPYFIDNHISLNFADTNDLRDQLYEAALYSEELIHEAWSSLAKKYDTHILAGSGFVAREGELFNRALLYNNEGELQWWQDKIYLGYPEQQLLNLGRGSFDDVRSFEIGGARFALSICRDTYNQEWESRIPEADIWIDIKANELKYDRAYFDAALPSRLPHCPIDLGLTVSLVGNMFGFTFTGRTSLHENASLLVEAESISQLSSLDFRFDTINHSIQIK